MGGCLIKWSYHIRWRCLRQSCLIKQGCHINNNVMCILVKARDFTQLCSLSLHKIQREGFGNNVKNLVRKSSPSPANVRKFGENILDPRKVCAFCGLWNKREVFLLHLYHWNLAAEISYQDTFFFRNMSLFLQGGWVVNFPRISHFCHMSSLGGGGWV